MKRVTKIDLAPLDDSPKRARAQKAAEAATRKLRDSENGRFWWDSTHCEAFKLSNIELSGELLGSGTFSERVERATYKPRKMDIAVKIMRVFDRMNNDNEGQGITERSNEVEILRKVTTNPNVVTLYGFLTHETDFYMCMELMDANLDELRKLIYVNGVVPNLPKSKIESFLGCVAVSVVGALIFLRNEAHVIHRDLKPHNITVNKEGLVKLCDFGVSKKLQTAVSDTRAITKGAGTYMYMAPERFDAEKGDDEHHDAEERHGTSSGYGSKAEVWSLGITLLEFATGEHPYKEATTNFVMEYMLKDPKKLPKLKHDSGYSLCLRNFVQDCLYKFENHRSSIRPEDGNNLQSKKFYGYHAARDSISEDPTPCEFEFRNKPYKEIPRRACVIEVLNQVKAGLPGLRSTLNS